MPQNTTGTLELQINSRNVRVYPPASEVDNEDQAIASMTPTAFGPRNPPSICLLSGSLDEFTKYSGQEASKWLIDIAHDICDPAQKRGSLVVWKELQQKWFLVDGNDPLTASTYRYDLPDATSVGLSKISRREGSSATSKAGKSTAMSERVKLRDERCWVTRVRRVMASRGAGGVVNSHILPRRMGDHVARILFRTFTSITPPPALSIYDNVFGLCLSPGLGGYFGYYELGFRYLSENLYECHAFADESEGHVTTEGIMDELGTATLLQGLPARPPHPERPNVPPPGLFRWHYLQCVIKKFAHDEYREFANIYHYELPVRMRGDSDDDDEGTDSEFDWPTKAFDLGRVVEHDAKELEDRKRSTAAWVSSV